MVDLQTGHANRLIMVIEGNILKKKEPERRGMKETGEGVPHPNTDSEAFLTQFVAPRQSDSDFEDEDAVALDSSRSHELRVIRFYRGFRL